jgi:hypothetical protein
VALLAAAIFLLSVTNGDFDLHGDDTWALSGAHFYKADRPYLYNMAKREYLTLSYVYLFRAMGKNPRAEHWLFLLWHVFNTGLLFLLLNRVFGPRPAFAGSLLYLVYSGTLETITWMAAGLYLPVITGILASVWIALSALNEWIKGVLIAVILWVSMHFYEMPLVVAPLYPLLIAVYRKRAGRRIATWDFLPSWFPLGLLCIHWFLVFLGARIYRLTLLWNRNPTDDTSAFGILRKTFLVARLSFSTCCGSIRFNWLKNQISGLLDRDHFGASYWVLLAIALALILYAWFRSPGSKPVKGPFVLYMVALYLILLSPLIAVTVVEVMVPDRYLVLCALGLALLTAAIVARWPSTVALAVILAIVSIQAFADQSAFIQEETARQFDRRILDPLHAFDLHPQVGDRFFFSLPDVPERHTFWHAAAPQLLRAGYSSAVLLLPEYGFPKAISTIPIYERIEALGPQIREAGASSDLNVPLSSPGDPQLYSFRLDGDGLDSPGKLRALTPLRIRVNGIVVREYMNPGFDRLPASSKEAADVMAAWQSGDDVQLNYYAPDLLLEIECMVYRKPPGGRIDLVAQGEVLGSITPSNDGEIAVLRAPLSKLTSRFKVEGLKAAKAKIVASPGLEWGYRSSRFVSAP